MGHIKIVEATVGLKSVGKGLLGKRLAAKFGFTLYTMSTPIRAMADRELGLGPGGESLYKVADLVRIADRERGLHGPGYWAEELVRLADERAVERLAVDGIRNPGEIEALRKALPPGVPFHLMGVVAPFEMRYAWHLARKQDGDPLSLEGFREMDRVDRGGPDQPDYGQQVDRCLAMVKPEDTFENVGSLEDYYAWIDARAVRDLAEIGITVTP